MNSERRAVCGVLLCSAAVLGAWSFCHPPVFEGASASMPATAAGTAMRGRASREVRVPGVSTARPAVASTRLIGMLVGSTLGVAGAIAQTRRRASFEEVSRKVEDFVATPGRIKDKTQQAVGEVMDAFASENGRILDTDTPAGTVGALAVGLAVLPYIPVSLYSTWLLFTTGTGIEPGPMGIYGIAEGFATIVVCLVAAWATTSFVTRGRGLPPGPFGILALTQAAAYICFSGFAAAIVLNSGQQPPEGLPTPSLPSAESISDSFEAASDALEAPGDFFADLKLQAEKAKLSVTNAASDISSAATDITSKVNEASATAKSSISEGAAQFSATSKKLSGKE